MSSRESIQRRLDEFNRENGEWLTDIQLPFGVRTRPELSEDPLFIHRKELLRRVVQVVCDVLPGPLSECRILDLGCLEGLFPLEFALRGARTVGVEGREANYRRAVFCKECYGLDHLEFRLDDVRNLSREAYGTFDAIICCGLLYHLRAPEAVRLVGRLYEMAERAVIIDTPVALEARDRYLDDGIECRGMLYREHAVDSPPEVRAADRLASLDNSTSFWFTRPSLVNLLSRAGFSSIHESLAPSRMRPEGEFVYHRDGSRMRSGRCTFVAFKGEPEPLQAAGGPAVSEQPWPEGSLSYAFRASDPVRVSARTQKSVTGEPVVLSDDGAWCAFQNPRAVYVEGRRRRTCAGWVTSDGRLQVGAYDHETGNIEVQTIKKRWIADDHGAPSLLALPDRRLMLFYARPDRRGLYCRTTSRPERIDRWRSKVCITDMKPVLHPQPVYLSRERRYFVFWRGLSSRPTFSTSRDGRTWSDPRILIRDEGREGAECFPFFLVASDGVGSMHFVFTDDDPRREPANSIYYLRYEAGEFFRADGTRVGTLETLPVAHRESDQVFCGSSGWGKACVGDLAIGRDGRAVLVYVRMPDVDEHIYHYARWTGDAWADYEMTSGGRWFPQTPEGEGEPESHYSGGLALDPGDPAIVYLSRQVDDTFILERWRTGDGGQSWTAERLPDGKAPRNVRPVVPAGGSAPAAAVLWMQGNYVGPGQFRTAIVLQTLEDSA